MNKNFDKEQKQKRLKDFPSNANPIAIPLVQVKNEFKYGCKDLGSLEEFLNTVKKESPYLDFIFALSFRRLLQMPARIDGGSYLYYIDYDYDFSFYNYLKILSKYEGVTNSINSPLPKTELSPEVTNFWTSVFSKAPSYDEYFSSTGLYFKDACALIKDFETISQKISLQRALEHNSKLSNEMPPSISSKNNKI